MDVFSMAKAANEMRISNVVSSVVEDTLKKVADSKAELDEAEVKQLKLLLAMASAGAVFTISTKH